MIYIKLGLTPEEWKTLSYALHEAEITEAEDHIADDINRVRRKLNKAVKFAVKEED